MARTPDDHRRQKLKQIFLEASKGKKSKAEQFLDSLTYELFDVFGGARGVAMKTLSEFNAAPEGGVVRKDLLKSMYGLFEKVQRSQPKDVEDMTEEELEDAAVPAALAALSDDDMSDLFDDEESEELGEETA
jgi:hypothetical protein